MVGRVARSGANQWWRGHGRGQRQRAQGGRPDGRQAGSQDGPPRGSAPRPATGQNVRRGYPGDFTGVPALSYAPRADGLPDPGEIVWTWVPFEEDHTEGKDRPVLIIGEDGTWLLGLMLTSQDHDLDEAQEARAGRFWVDIGSGSWDRRGRSSEVRVDRIVRVDPGQVRREGAVLGRERFEDVAAAVRSMR